MGRYGIAGRALRSPLNPGWSAGQGLRGASAGIDDMSPMIAQFGDQAVDQMSPVLGALGQGAGESVGGNIGGMLGGQLLGDGTGAAASALASTLSAIPGVGPVLAAGAAPAAQMGGQAIGTMAGKALGGMAGKALATGGAKLGGRMLTRMGSDALQGAGNMLSGGSDSPATDTANKGMSAMRMMRGFSPFGAGGGGDIASQLAQTLAGGPPPGEGQPGFVGPPSPVDGASLVPPMTHMSPRDFTGPAQEGDHDFVGPPKDAISGENKLKGGPPLAAGKPRPPQMKPPKPGGLPDFTDFNFITGKPNAPGPLPHPPANLPPQNTGGASGSWDPPPLPQMPGPPSAPPSPGGPKPPLFGKPQDTPLSSMSPSTAGTFMHPGGAGEWNQHLDDAEALVNNPGPSMDVAQQQADDEARRRRARAMAMGRQPFTMGGNSTLR